MLSCGGQGFLCRDDVVAENLTNNAVGCLGVCSPGWRLVADPRNGGQWYCTNITTPICPGKFNTGGFTSNSSPPPEGFSLSECACEDPNDCPIGECECDGQLRVSQDCKTAQ